MTRQNLLHTCTCIVSNEKASWIKSNMTIDDRYCKRIKVKILYTSKRTIKQIKKTYKLITYIL